MRRREGEKDVVALARRTWQVAAERFGPPLYARVDVLRSTAGEPAVLELELVEPSLYLDFARGPRRRSPGHSCGAPTAARRVRGPDEPRGGGMARGD